MTLRLLPWAALYVVALACLPLGSLVAGDYPDGIVLFGRMHAVMLWVFWAVALTASAAAAWRLARLNPWLAIGAQLVLGAYLALAVDLLPSSDAYMYLFYGQTLAHGKNPWSPIHLDPATRDPLERIVVRLYGDVPVPSVYGPAFVDPESIVAAATAAFPLRWRLVAQRLLALAALALLALAMPRSRRTLWALNPFILFEAAIGAHNDVFMLLGIAGAMRLRRTIPAGIAFGLATLLKGVAIFAVLVRPRLALGGALVLAAFALVQPYAFNLPTTVHYLSVPTYSAVLTPLLARYNVVAPIPFLRIALVVTLVVLFIASRRARRDRPILLALAALTIPPITAPWYALWVAFAGAWSHRRAFALAWAFPGLLFALYLVFWY